MTTKEALDYFGSRKALAQALNIWPHTINRWGERPPMLRQLEIEELTHGELKRDSVRLVHPGRVARHG